MKKYIYIFSIMLFFIFIPNVRAENYLTCIYEGSNAFGRNGYHAALHVSNGAAVIDVYKDRTILEDFSMRKVDIVNSAGIDTSSLPGVDTTYERQMDIKFLTIRCPKQMCENGNRIWIDEDGCNLGTGTYYLTSSWTEEQISGLSEYLSFQYGAADPSKVDYESILSGSCPSDVAVFKLFKTAYSLLKIIAPIALVLFATIDLAKAVAAADESVIKKAQKHCLKRIAAAVIVLLSFVIVEMIINMASGGSDIMSCVNEFLK